MLFKWATRGLQVGDMTALRELARGWRTPDQDQVQRLVKRGFATTDNNGQSTVTITGRVALFIRSRLHR